MRDPAFRPKLRNVKFYSQRVKPRRRSRASPCQIAALRLNDLARLFRARYGVTLPDDDAGREDAMIACQHLASLREPIKRIDQWLILWCPWITLKERDALASKVLLHRQKWTSDQLAWRLRLIDADRTVLGITTIGAIDCSLRERKKRRLAKQKERSASNRKARLQHKVFIAANADPEKP